jgi:hypothetical protein
MPNGLKIKLEKVLNIFCNVYVERDRFGNWIYFRIYLAYFSMLGPRIYIEQI